MMFHSRDATYSKRDTPFQRLRKEAHRQSDRATRERLRTNQIPTKEEVALGTFVETIEPQVRQAVRTFNRKGYQTWSSGFYGYGESQGIDGAFVLTKEAKRILRTLGCMVRQGHHGGFDYTSVTFEPKEPDMEKIRRHWNRIAAALPNLGRRASFSESFGSEVFRWTFAPDHLATEIQRHELRLEDHRFIDHRTINGDLRFFRQMAAIKRRYAHHAKKR